MLQTSRFVKIYPLGKNYAYYHSLGMVPVYVTEEQHRLVQWFLRDGKVDSRITEVLTELQANRIFINDPKEDSMVLSSIRKQIPEPYTSIAYFILTEQCNLACKYCFLGNNSPLTGSKQSTGSMTKEIAEKGVSFFSKMTQKNQGLFDEEKNIIFYGGEPLMNFDVLCFIVEKVKNYQNSGKITKNLVFSIVTNGILLDEKKIEYLAQNNINISISIDGSTAQANSNRVDFSGANSFSKVIRALNLAKIKKTNIGLSVTLTKETLMDIEGLISLINQYGIKDLSFNILLNTDTTQLSPYYYNVNFLKFYHSNLICR